MGEMAEGLGGNGRTTGRVDGWDTYDIAPGVKTKVQSVSR